MAEPILYGVAQTIIENLGSMVFAEIGSMWGVKDEFEKLEDTVSAVQAVLLDAEEQQVKNRLVKHWLMRLRDAVYDADDLLTEFYTEDMRQRVMGGDQMAKTVRTSLTTFFSSSNQLAFRDAMAKKITSMRERFDAIANDMNKFQFVVHPSETRVVTRVRDQTYSFVCEEEVIGREEDKKAIIDLLLDYDVQENVSFISIVGIGGLGKTTLAQYVYNDEKVKNYFDLRMWVCISDVFDVKTIAEKIIRCADISKHENLDMEQVQNKLRETLNQKKYLLVLDDVWNEDEEKWCNLKRLLIGGSKGNKVVITTRTKLVAEITSSISPYYLQGLSKNQSWSLFKQMAFKKRQEMINPNLEAIGRDIVQKCCGVPLAIKAIGRILFFKKTEDDWLYIKNKELTNVTQEENNSGILPILKLSYDHLPSHLKCCLAYCSLFPKDHEISKLTLINLWIAQGFIQSSNEELRMEDVANDYCMDLLWRSFFQEAREDSFGNVISFKMHDLIHDLAQSISRVECTYIDSNIENVKKNVRHLSIASHNVLKKDLSSLSKAKKIRTLILITGPMAFNRYQARDQGEEESSCQKPPLEIHFSSLRCLRALSLCGSDIINVPNSIEELTYLKYLDLSGNKFEVLPGSITRLLNLQTLNLSCCDELKELPGNIQNLFNLRSLELEGCDSLTYMPPGIGQLTSLQVLPLFIVNEGLTCAGLPELNKLNNLRGELRIRIKVRVKDATSKAKAANLKDKQHLRELELIWNMWGNVGVCEDENLMEGLQPHRNLKSLKVKWYQGVRFPSWLPSLTGLVILEISYSMCQYLSPMYQLPNLRNLSLEFMDGLEYISDREITEGISASSTFFPSLESLKLQNCRNLKGWWRRATVGVATSSQQYQPHVSFPRLLQLEIRGCKNLTCMPLFPNLEEPLRLTESSCNPLQQTMNMKAISSVPSASNSSPPLSKLEFLSLDGIQDIELLPEQWLQNLASLEELRIERCNRLKSLSLSLFMQHLTSLKTLSISQCAKVDLFCDEDTQSVGVSPQITVLENLRIFSCCNLISLPEGIGNLTALQNLKISNLPCLVSLPEGTGNLTALQNLQISHLPSLVSLPEGIGNLTALQNLGIYDLPRLLSLPEGIGNLTALQNLGIYDLPRLVSLPEGIGNLTALQKLEIYNLPCLISLEISNSMCQYLSPMYQLPNLRNLSLEDMDGLEYISDREITEEISASSTFFPSLESLKLQNCPNLKGWWRRATVGVATSSQQYQPHVSFPRLLQLEIRGCKNLTCMPLFPNLEKPLRLTGSSCNPLQQTNGPEDMTRDRDLDSEASSYSDTDWVPSNARAQRVTGYKDTTFLDKQEHKSSEIRVPSQVRAQHVTGYDDSTFLDKQVHKMSEIRVPSQVLAQDVTGYEDTTFLGKQEHKMSEIRFSCGLELANIVVSSGVLNHSWAAVQDLYSEINQNEQPSLSVRYKVSQQPNCTMIAFVTWPVCSKDYIQGGVGGDLVSSSTHKESFPLFEFLRTKTNPDFSINRAALELFASIRDRLASLKSEIDSRLVIITGNCLGGSVASLFTLWLLDSFNLSTKIRPLCITFGSPLVGDDCLQEAISKYPTGNSCFLHVVSDQDPIPRVLISHCPMGLASQTNVYKPFGTFLLCSELGCACFEDSQSILELLMATYSEGPENQNPNQVLEFYDALVQHLNHKVIRKDATQLVERNTESLMAGIITQLEAIGLERPQQQQQNNGINSLITKTERQEKELVILKRHAFDPSKKLNDMEINMVLMEWYKKNFKDKRIGYYDSYKNLSYSSDHAVVRYKKMLTCYWEKLVDEVEKKPHKEGVSFRTQWLSAGTDYRRMIEPLDIAEYYNKGLKDYINQGRPKHYKQLEQWLNEANKPASNSNQSKKQNVASILSKDSCFWAHVEEARISCKLLTSRESSIKEKESSKQNLIKFEKYVLCLMKNDAVSPEIFLPWSSYMLWWKEYERIIRKKIMGTCTSDFTDLMKDRGYQKYSTGCLEIL